MNAPCKDCPERHMGCHSECEKYIAYHQFREEVLKRKEQDRVRCKSNRKWVPNKIRGDQ
jgi:hypothetical protein|nr:MAG TPA: hypothetical protein [Caudoviricetes sp.]